MHVEQFLHTLLSPVTHLKRLRTLTLLVSAVLKEKKLSVTLLGRSMDNNNAQEKNNIKRSDRFLSNTSIQKERHIIYKAMANQLIYKDNPWIIVDWSHVPNTNNYILRAALVAKGRALTIYEEVHPKKLENNPNIHKKFLAQLKNILPEGVCPVIIADAGFCNPWFQAVLDLKWDYLGRVRGKKNFLLQDKKIWDSYTEYQEAATSEGKSLGEGKLSKSNPIITNFYLIKLPKKNRFHINKLKKKGKQKKDKEYSKSANEPWLLVSSLKQPPEIIFEMYSTRMSIEEGFRDLKSSQYGFSFEKSYSTNINRIQILLMIAMVASIIAYLIGVYAEKNNLQYKFQANSSKNRRILSLFYLGCRIIKKSLIIPYEAILKMCQQPLSPGLEGLKL
jgi:hypothetical protein